VRAFELSNGNIEGVIAALQRGEPADEVVTMVSIKRKARKGGWRQPRCR